MAYDDRYGDQDRSRNPERGRGRSDGDRDHWSGRDEGGHDGGRRDERGFFERAGEWLSGESDSDRSPGSRSDYYRGGDRGQSRTGPEGGFETRDEYRRSDRYAEQGQAGRGRDDTRGGGQGGASYGGMSGGFGDGGERGEGNRVGGGRYGASTTNPDATFGGLGVAPEFSDGPRFDRQDIGWTGSHGVHPVSSFYGEAQRDPMGVGAMGGGGSSARERAILQQAEQHGGRGRVELGDQARSGQSQPRGMSQGGQQRSRYEHDPHYHQWRQSQIESLDRDYEEYRRENASRFETEFSSFREKRGQQRQSLGRAKEHMEVLGSDGQHVGTVDKVAGDRIILTKSDPAAGGHHHSIPCSWVETVDDKVTLNKTAEAAMKAWRDEETSRALFERPDSGSDGPHILERSFSGTYRDEDR